MTVAVVLGAAALLIALGTHFIVSRGVRRLKPIEEIPPLDLPEPPPISIIVPARNEERGIEAGVGSLLRQTYPALEIVVVNDRSSDRTGEIIDLMAARDSRIVPVHLTDLPAGWLGKNHALWVGAKRARSEWLLFADADIVMAPETVSRAMSYALERRLDHVPMTPRLELPGPMLQAFGAIFTFFFCAYFQPWKASDPKSRHFVGVGAFNLVRRTAYERAGTHERIALRPDDDVKLGKILKQSGGRQELVSGSTMMSVKWYHSLRELIVGLEKNTFAGVDYNVAVSVISVIAQAVLTLGPLIGAIVAGGLARWLFILSIAVTIFSFAGAASALKLPRSRALWYPVVVLLFDFIVLRTMIKNLVDGGIRWRDTFYPLDQLKANRV